jgi:transposase
MLSLSLPGRVFLCTLATDMRKSFDSLAALVQQHLGQDPLSGDLFVFRSKRGDRLKLLYWDNDGLAIWYKRLEEGTFAFPAPDEQRTAVGSHGLAIRPAELAMLLDGIDLAGAKRRRRYQRPHSAPAAPAAAFAPAPAPASP